MANDRQWLQAERNGPDQLAEQLFARWVADMPGIEAAPDFVSRTVQAAWRARARRRRAMRLLRVAAALVLGITTLGSLYALVASGLAVRATVMLSRGLAWLLTSTGEGARWWWIAERIGSAVGGSVASPSTGLILMALEMAALLALYAFHRLLQKGWQTRPSRKIRT